MSHKLKNVLKWCSALGGSAFASWTLYQSFQGLKFVRKPLNTNCMFSRSEWIYIKHNFLREPIKDFLNEFFEEETRIYSFLYNLRRKMTFTKLDYALRVLKVASDTNDPFIRRKANNNLSKIDYLDDWEYQFVSQYIDASTAVCLARYNCNSNFIRKPREFSQSSKSNFDIISDIKKIFESMKENKCVKYILDTSAFESCLKDPDHETSLHEIRHEMDHIIQSLEHFLHLTQQPETCFEIIAKHNGLDILTDIYKGFKDNIDIKMILAKIITNMSSGSDGILDHFYKSGWIYLLSNWKHDDDLRFQVFASTSLNNLDKFDTIKFKYKSKLYPLYPRDKIYKKPDLDLLFVHGLLGGIWITWRVQQDADMMKIGNDIKDQQNVYDESTHNSFFKEEAVFRNENIVQMEPSTASKILTITEQTTKNVLFALNEMAEEKLSVEDLKFTKKILKHLVTKINEQKYSFCWPIDWLPQKYPTIRVLGLQFESSLSYWTSKVCSCEKNKRRLRNISEDYLERLKDAGIGQREIIWVCHSMGGLIVKYIINMALASNDPEIRQIGENSRGIFFLGCPHRGSIISKLSKQTSAILWPTVEVQDLEENSKELIKLNEQFIDNIKKMKSPVEIVSIAEGTSTKIFQNISLHVVPISSAYLGYGDFYISHENHLNLSKPISQNSFIYTALTNMIEKVLKNQKK